MSPKTHRLQLQIDADVQEKIFRITLPGKIFRELQGKGRPMLRVGMLKGEVECTANDTEEILTLSPSLAEKFPLYQGMKTCLILEKNELRLGPVVGTLTEPSILANARAGRPGKRITGVAKANEEAGTILYFFSEEDVNYSEKRIQGTCYNPETNTWDTLKFPFPDVLYSLEGNWLRLKKEAFEKIKRCNPEYRLDKWEVFQSLRGMEELRPFLPAALQLKRAEELKKLMERSPDVYLKERNGNRGIGVTKISRCSDGFYELRYFNRLVYYYEFETFEELYKKVVELFKNKRAIAQSAVDTLIIDRGNVDIRATLQRTGSGELSVTACPVRIGRREYPVTNTRTGARVMPLEVFLEEHLKYSKAQIAEETKRVEAFLIKCYRGIEKSFGPFAEMDIDAALDKKGKLWFIDCSANPLKDTITLFYGRETIHKAFLRPLEYAKYLCGFFE